MTHQAWPSWRYGPEGQSAIFEHEEQVPDGWEDHPSKVKNGAHPPMTPGYDEPQEIRDGQGAVTRGGGLAALSLNKDNAKKSEQPPRNFTDEVKPVTAPESLSKTELPPIEEISKQDIVTQLSAKKVQFNSGWNKEKLYDLLKDAQ